MNAEISIKGMEPEWLAKEGAKSNKLIRARMTEQMGDVDKAMTLYAEVAQEEEQLYAYCRSLGLIEKSWIKAISAASCWEAAGDLYRALQGYESLLNDPTLTPRMRTQVCDLAEKLRERRRQWAAFSRQFQNEEQRPAAEPARTAETVAA